MVILCSTKISPVHVNALKSDKKIIQEFVNSFVEKMYLLEVDYNLRRAKTNYPDAWALSDRIFFDGLNKNEFYRTLRKIYNAHMYANFILNKACVTSGKGADIKKIRDKSSDIPFYG